MIPSFFIAHGSPDIVIQEDNYTNFLAKFKDSIEKPRAVLVFTAHWESSVQTISSVSEYDLIYDFGGFSKELYEVKYPAKGNHELAEKIKRLLKEKGIGSIIDNKRGLDHGAWSILKLMYPMGEMPIIQLSVNPYLSNSEQYKIGKSLEDLKDEGVLIIGSGGTVHNLSAVNFYGETIDQWAVEFDDFIKDRIGDWDLEALFKYDSLAPNAKKAVPTNEHFIPLLLAMGVGDELKKGKLLYRDYQFGNLSRSVWKFE